MENNLENKIPKTIQKLNNTTWFSRFFNMLESCGVEPNLISESQDLAFENNMKYDVFGNHTPFQKNKEGEKATNEFFEYMSNKCNEIGLEEFKNFLSSSLISTKESFVKYSESDRKQKTNFLNLFMRSVITKFPQDIKMVTEGSPIQSLENGDEGSIRPTLAGINLGWMEYTEFDANIPTILSMEFRTLPGLEGLGLGSYTFDELCKQIHEHKPSHSFLFADVMPGADGDKVYSKWGGFPVNVDETLGINPTPLNNQEKQEVINNNKSFSYYFSPEIIEKHAQKTPKYGTPILEPAKEQ